VLAFQTALQLDRIEDMAIRRYISDAGSARPAE
jgi:hypothetical protein